MTTFSGAYEREHQNLMSQPTITCLFDKILIDAMFDPSRNYQFTRYVSHFFVTVDPSAGLFRSNYVFLSMCFLKNPNSNEENQADNYTCIVCINNYLLFVVVLLLE